MHQGFAERARTLVGVRFRPQGRDPAIGLDCVGVVAATFGVRADEVPRDYRLRGDHGGALTAGLLRHFVVAPDGDQTPGDVLLLSVGADQLHLAVGTDRGFVHADARLGRVVETPGEAPWPVLGIYRMPDPQMDGTQ